MGNNSEEPILRDRYEVIVVGTGLGGLCAAAVLAHEGIDVLMVERSGRPGGCCSSFRAGDFTFDSAASIFHGFGEVGFHVHRTLFDFLNQQIEITARDTAYCMYLGDHKIHISNDIHAFQAELGATFPKQAGSIISFMKEMGHIYHAVLECSGPPKPRADEPGLHALSMLARHPVSVPLLSRYARRSAGHVFRRHLDETLIQAFFNADLTYGTGYDMAELSSPHAAIALMERHTGGTHYPIGSSQQIPDRLEKSIVEHGGRILYRTPVDEILVENGRAVGVRLSGGRAIHAAAVISNAQVGEVFGRLVSPEHLKPQTLQDTASLEPTAGVTSLYLGVRESVVPADFCPNTLLVDDPQVKPGRILSISVPSMNDPNLSPEGFHSVCIHYTAESGRWPAPGDPEHRSDSYLSLKEQAEKEMFDRAEGLLPGLRGSVVEKRFATPTTHERYTARTCGAVGGPRMGDRLVPGGLPGAVTEIGGLMLAGDSTFSGRGIASAAASGINAALATLRYLGLRPPRFHRVRESPVMETVPVRPEISGEQVVDRLSAVIESHRCLRCDDTPCRTGCPAGVDISNFIRRVGAADFAGAARTIRESTPLGEVCGRVCPVERFCEGVCRRALIDRPVRIGQLEALSCELASGPEGWPEQYRGERREKVAVVGSGPAGISCAYYLSLLGYSVEMFEAGAEAGGLPARAMPESRISHRVVSRETGGTMRAGIEFRGNTVFGRDVDFESLYRDGFRAVFLGAGLQCTRLSGIPGADMPGVIDAVGFLCSARRRVKRELARRVAVIGEGDAAMDAAVTALEMGAEKVFLLTGKPKGETGAGARSVSEARERGVRFAAGRAVREIFGEGRVEGIVTSPLTGSGAEVEGSLKRLKVETVIMAGEREPDRSLSDYLSGHLRMNADGTVAADPGTLMTSRPGVFAGGDIVSGGGFVVTACAQGRRAALSIDRYLRALS